MYQTDLKKRFQTGFGPVVIVEVIRLENLFLVFCSLACQKQQAGTELAFWSSKKREGKKDIITQVVLGVVIRATDMPTYSKPNQVLKQVVCSLQGCRNREGARGKAPNILTDQLTLSQPEVWSQIMPTTFLLAPPPPLDFQTFLRPCYGPYRKGRKRSLFRIISGTVLNVFSMRHLY